MFDDDADDDDDGMATASAAAAICSVPTIIIFVCNKALIFNLYFSFAKISVESFK